MPDRSKWIILAVAIVVLGVFALGFFLGKKESSPPGAMSTVSVAQPTIPEPAEIALEAAPSQIDDPVGLYDPAVWTLISSTSSNLDNEHSIERAFLFRSIKEAARDSAGEALYEIQVLLVRESLLYDYRKYNVRRSSKFATDPRRFFFNDRIEIRSSSVSAYPEIVFWSGYPTPPESTVLEHVIRFDQGKNKFLHSSAPI